MRRALRFPKIREDIMALYDVLPPEFHIKEVVAHMQEQGGPTTHPGVTYTPGQLYSSVSVTLSKHARESSPSKFPIRRTLARGFYEKVPRKANGSSGSSGNGVAVSKSDMSKSESDNGAQLPSRSSLVHRLLELDNQAFDLVEEIAKVQERAIELRRELLEVIKVLI